MLARRDSARCHPGIAASARCSSHRLASCARYRHGPDRQSRDHLSPVHRLHVLLLCLGVRLERFGLRARLRCASVRCAWRSNAGCRSSRSALARSRRTSSWGCPMAIPAIARSNPAVLRTREFRVLQIHVVDHLPDGPEGESGQAKTGEEDLEGAQVTFVGELGVEHVESELTAFVSVGARIDETYPGGRVDEAPDEPRTRHPVHVDSTAGDPDRSSGDARLGRDTGGRACLRSCREHLLQTVHQALGRLATWCSEAMIPTTSSRRFRSLLTSSGHGSSRLRFSPDVAS